MTLKDLDWPRALAWCERHSTALVLAFGAALFLPRLGSVGLFDPWETHYAEVAREMIARGDWIHPHWSNGYFFSKPVLSMWLMAAGMLATGAESASQTAPLGSWVEWGVRFPFALLSILTLWSVHRLGRHVAGPRVGLLAAFVLGTSPLFALIGKQAVTDVPLQALTWAGLAFLIPAVFPREGRPDAPLSWFLAAGALFGLAALAKGLLVGALVVPAFLAVVILVRDWDAIRRSRPFVLAAAFLLVAAPWYVAMVLFPGRDDEGLTFASRFFGHDHLARLNDGVHGDRGGAGYYFEQLLYGFFPWSAVLPVALVTVARERTEKPRSALLFVLVFGLWVYALFTVCQTKFHHYVFPALPALALVLAVWLGRWLEDRAARLTPGLLALGAVLYLVALRDLLVEPRRLVNLFTYQYERAFPTEVVVRPFLVAIAGGGAALILLALLGRRWRIATGAFAATALSFALWLSHHHFNMLSPHLSQAHVIGTYFAERREGEPLLAWQLNWRGENFYSRNQAIELLNAGAREALQRHVERPGRTFIVVETQRFKELRNALPASARERLEILDRSNCHFYLCVVNEG